MPFSLDHDQPRLTFERNPLESVICQVRFPPLLAVDDPTVRARFQGAIRDAYPLAERGARSPADDEPPPEGTSAPWTFRDDGGEWTVALDRSFLALETNAYVRYEDFRDRLERLLAAAEETLEITHTERIGLRYVDRIEPPGAKSPADFSAYLNVDLIGVVAGAELSPYVVDAMQFIRLDVADHRMAIRHGFVGPETGDPRAPFYLIDTDAYRQGREPYDRSACLESVDAFKRRCWNFFRQSIDDKLIDHLRPVNADA